ncbi:hypothetical protein PN36_09120 [Candidatus Thiomargarita nelsonii]|uniref:Uncharacterized protein n=1 Tax=Candidatus Thiomargarita nelsonii TaxID=1003181 RepID=A0A4E0QWE5_9GAMM|nr:hypothetical protein PN36_09120 [Candidatus Thiomargarita nelsonii]
MVTKFSIFREQAAGQCFVRHDMALKQRARPTEDMAKKNLTLFFEFSFIVVMLEVVSLPHQKKWILKHQVTLSFGEGIKG